MPPRSCTPCHACCDYPAIPELDKPAYQLCAHASCDGCGIYAERPQPCRDYRCLWIEGEFDDGDRPDQIGLAFDQPSLVADHSDYAGVHVICAREVWPGAREGVRAQNLILRLSRAMIVRLVAPGGTTELIGPKRLVEQVARRATVRRQVDSEPS